MSSANKITAALEKTKGLCKRSVALLVSCTGGVVQRVVHESPLMRSDSCIKLLV